MYAAHKHYTALGLAYGVDISGNEIVVYATDPVESNADACELLADLFGHDVADRQNLNQVLWDSLSCSFPRVDSVTGYRAKSCQVIDCENFDVDWLSSGAFLTLKEIAAGVVRRA